MAISAMENLDTGRMLGRYDWSVGALRYRFEDFLAH